MFTKILSAKFAIVAIFSFAMPNTAIACGQEAAWSAGKLKKQLHRKLRSVRGTFVIERVESALVKEETYDGAVTYETRTIWGTVTDRRGRTYNTLHQASNLFLLCAATIRPGYDAIGTFYLSRRPTADGVYALGDFEGKPLNMPSAAIEL